MMYLMAVLLLGVAIKNATKEIDKIYTEEERRFVETL